MNVKELEQIFLDTAYVRTGGSREELRCAEYLKEQCAKFGGEAFLESFQVDMSEIHEASLTADGEEITCKGYRMTGTAQVEAPFYYLRATDKYSLSLCKGKIVMVDGYMGGWLYKDITEHGAVGFITYDGNANYTDEDIDQRELRKYVSQGTVIPGVNINAKQAIALIQNEPEMVKITISQDEFEGESHNVILDLPGETEEYIVLTAHYDSTSLSQGAYDNMSGSVGLLGLAEHFIGRKHRYGLRFVWCGSEERGLLGSKAYVDAHEEELKHIVLNINLDMIGCIMGKFIACCTTEDKLVHFLQYFAGIQGFGIQVSDGVYSSDSTPFADKGVPALSFARIAPNNTATIHNSYDTIKVMKMEQMQKDIEFICSFTELMANAACCPVERKIPDKLKEKLDNYMLRKREEK